MVRKHALLIGINRYPELDEASQLEGSVRDVEAMAQLLEHSFGFPPPRVLIDEEATRAGILSAMAELERRVEEDDIVVFHFSGHGSQMVDREGDEPDGLDETLVPFDSGRGTAPNLDITDDEIFVWLSKLTRKTDRVTLIVDACHSATIVRDSHGWRERGLPADDRGPDALPPSPLTAKERALLICRRRQLAEHRLPLAADRYTLISACRDEERAFEIPISVSPRMMQGALTFYLCQEIAAARAGTTCREVVERLRPKLQLYLPRQHPQLEGLRDRVLFGIEEYVPNRFFPILEGTPRVVVGAGAAFGFTEGCELSVYPSGTRGTSGEVEVLGRLRLDRVGAVRSRAVRFAGVGDIEPGCRAFETSHCYREMRSTVEVISTGRRMPEIEEMKQRIGSSSLLRQVDEEAQIRVYGLLPRRSCREGDPVPQLGALKTPTWAAVGEDGQLALPPLSLRAPVATPRMVASLERLARYRNLLCIENRDPESQLAEGIRAVVWRQGQDGSWHPAETDAEGRVPCAVGECFGLEIDNRSSRDLYISVLDFGLAGGIQLLYPTPGANELLPAGRSHRIGMLPREVPLEFRLPQATEGSNPESSATAGLSETAYLKIFATSHEADFEALRQQDYHRAFSPNSKQGKTSFGRLMRLALVGGRMREADRRPKDRVEDWATAILAFCVK